MSSPDEQLPDDLPAPEDDGAADHLVGLAVPELADDVVAWLRTAGRPGVG